MITLLTLLVLVVAAALAGVASLSYSVGYGAGRTDEAASRRRADRTLVGQDS